MTVRSVKKIETSGKCPICLDDMNEPKKVVITRCDHAFHEKCITFNLNISEKTRTSCPYCRQVPIPMVRAQELPDNLESNPYIECSMIRALRNGDLEHVKAALSANPQLIEQVYESNSKHIKSRLLTLAVAFGHQELVVFLLEKSRKTSIDEPNSDGLNALSTACLFGHTQIAKLLITAGAKVNNVNHKGQNALWFAAYAGKKEILELLVEAGSSVTHKSEGNFTALFTAAHKGHLEAVNYLISVIPKPQLKEHINICASPSTSPATALYMAAQKGYTHIVSSLILAGANLNLAVNGGRIPLHIAALNGHLDVVKILIANGSCVNHQGLDGISALFCAAADGHSEICKYLLTAKADPSLNSKEGVFDRQMNAAMVARANGHIQLAEYIEHWRE